MRKTVSEVLEKGYSVIVVDDCSKDGSKKQLAGLPVYYLRHRVNLGQGAALQTGIDYAKKKGAKYFVTFDADGQHDGNDIAGMINLIEQEKSDIVFWFKVFTGIQNQCLRFQDFCFEYGEIH